MDLTKSIQEAIHSTNLQHIKLSEYSISFAPEYLITVNIANELSNLQKCSIIHGVYLEWNIQDLLEEEKIKDKTNIRDGKCDICILFNDNRNSIIEVKNTITQVGGKLKSIYKDIERIEHFILDKNSTFVDSYVCFIVKANSKSNVEIKTKKYITDIKNYFIKLELQEDINLFKEYDNDDEKYFLSSVVIKITKK